MTKTFQEVPAPAHTPWGAPQSAIQLAPGVILVETAFHGGIWLSPERNAVIPHWIKAATFNTQGLRGWYEEDCDIAIPLAAFPECKDRIPSRDMQAMSREEWLAYLRQCFAADIGATPGGLEAFETLTASWASQEA